ncbi:hypothetical protein MYX64_07325 [Nitrospinae bacterium AH_259_B05_G02_I21]|nr:hypothetical protein [Nitrospinae bacterium AH_259_B05_G02_I21]
MATNALPNFAPLLLLPVFKFALVGFQGPKTLWQSRFQTVAPVSPVGTYFIEGDEPHHIDMVDRPAWVGMAGQASIESTYPAGFLVDPMKLFWSCRPRTGIKEIAKGHLTNLPNSDG